ncbi:MAG: prolyl oligopeptidase family serine peptidase [Eubacteriales bacterium]|nr:prolyl oligopeptidase family serine peptidase [Eubacteriales bacterium]
MPRIISEFLTATDRNIPVILTYHEHCSNAPMVLLNHGTGGDAVGMQRLALRLANKEVFCVSVDAYQQGSRIIDRFNDLYFNENNSLEYKENYLRMLLHMAQDMSALIDYFTDDERADTSRVGMTGDSQGGYVAYMTMSKDARIKAAAPLIGSPDLRDKYGNSPEFHDLPQTLQQEINQHNPINNYTQISKTALLIQNGDADKIVPVSGVRKLNDKIKDLYKDRPDDYKYIEYPGMGHTTTHEMNMRAIEWLVEKL